MALSQFHKDCFVEITRRCIKKYDYWRDNMLLPGGIDNWFETNIVQGLVMAKSLGDEGLVDYLKAMIANEKEAKRMMASLLGMM